MFLFRILLCILCFNLFGCAFFQGERYADVFIDSKPEGAYIYKIYTRNIASGKIVNENAKFIGQTPARMKVPKDAHVMIVLASNGYKNKEFIIRTGYKYVYMPDGKTHTACTNEEYFGWMTGDIYNRLVKIVAPNLREQYCSADMYHYEIDLEKA